MKKVISIFIIIVFFSCKERIKEYPKTHATFAGKIKNLRNSSIRILGKDIRKFIKVENDGTFKDTIKINNVTSNGLIINNQQPTIFLKNGYHIRLEGDAENLETLKYSGLGADENNYLLSQFLYGGKISEYGQEFFALEKKGYESEILKFKKGLDSISNKYNHIDSTLLNLTRKQNEKVFTLLNSMYNSQHKGVKSRLEAINSIKKGTKLTPFLNLEGYDGKTHSLSDYKGSYVFIDFWAVWSHFYFKKLPVLNKIKSQYKNITYISICTENNRTSGTWSFAKEKWKKKITEKNLTDNQLFAGKDNTFLKDYNVFSLPRIIIIDPEGKVVNANAPKLESKELDKLLKKINEK